MNNIFIRGVELQPKTRGAVVEIGDDFIVFVNTVLSPECQHEAVEHELRHIKADHFYKDDPVVVDERQAGTV